MCFVRQWPARFQHLRFQKWSEAGVLGTSELPNLAQAWCALYILTWTSSSCHYCMHFFGISTSTSAPAPSAFLTLLTSKRAWARTGCNMVQLVISHLVTWLRTRRFNEPTFRPSRPTNHWKNTVFLFAHLQLPSDFLFFLLPFSSLTFLSDFRLGLLPSLRFICPYWQKFDF